MNLGGSLTRQNEHDASVSDASPHIVNIGKMVEVSSIYTFHIYFHGTDSKFTPTKRLEPLLTQNQTSLSLLLHVSLTNNLVPKCLTLWNLFATFKN